LTPSPSPHSLTLSLSQSLSLVYQACPVPLQFDYYFWNVTNAEEVRFFLINFFSR